MARMILCTSDLVFSSLTAIPALIILLRPEIHFH
jgi:hypothetical protein